MLLGLQKKHSFEMSQDEVEEYVARELDEVTKKLSEKCKECPGVTEQMEWIKAQGYPMAVVSTSAKPRVVASLKKTNLMRKPIYEWHLLTPILTSLHRLLH